MNSTASKLLRRVAALAAVAALASVAGCDEDGPAGGIGASSPLPAVITNFGGESVDTGVGSVHWVGNPRW